MSLAIIGRFFADLRKSSNVTNTTVWLAFCRTETGKLGRAYAQTVTELPDPEWKNGPRFAFEAGTVLFGALAAIKPPVKLGVEKIL